MPQAKKPDTSSLSGDDWAAYAEANPWPGDVQEKPGPLDVDGYEAMFDRSGTERRVLGHITDEDHVGRGGRNTLERLDVELGEDPFTRYETGDTDRLGDMLEALEDAGLIEVRKDGTYGVTKAGLVELAN